MKKLSLAMLGLFALSLTSCGTEVATTPKDTTTTPKDTTTTTKDVTPTTNTTTEVPTTSHVEATTTTNVTPTTTTENNEPIEPEVTGSALKNRINGLLDNINEFPDGGKVFLEKEESVQLLSKDYTEPTDLYYEMNPYYAYNSSAWDRIDSLKKETLEIRDYVLENVKQLNTWISDYDFIFNLEYDSVADEIHIQYKKPYLYYDITSGYTSDGDITITATRYDINGDLYFLDTLNYVENQKATLCSFYECNLGDNHFTRNYRLIESNFVDDEITELQRYVENDESNNYFYDYTGVKLLQEENGIKCISTVNQNGQLDMDLFDSDGYLLGDYTFANSSCSGAFSLYEFDGWDSVIYDESYPYRIVFTIDGKVYTEPMELEDPKGDLHFAFDAAGFDLFPCLRFYTYNDVLGYDDFLEIFEKNLGITPKHNYSDTINKLMSNYEEMAKNRCAFGLVDYSSIDVLTFQTLFDTYNLATLSLDEVNAMDSIEGMNKYWQEETNYDIGFVEGTVEGELLLDFDAMTLNPKDIIVKLPMNALLSSNLDYQARLIAVGQETKTICEGNITKCDNGLVLTFNDEPINILDFLSDGTASLEVVVGAKTEIGFHRVSKNMKLSSSLDNRTLELPLERCVMEENFVQFNVIMQRTLEFVKDNGVKLNVNVISVEKLYLDGEVEGELIFDFDSMSVNPKNITVKMSDPTLVSSKVEYQAMLVLAGQTIHEMYYGNVASTDDGLIITFGDASLNLLTNVVENDFTIGVVVGYRSLTGFNRISNVLKASSSIPSATYALPDVNDVIEENSIQYNVTYHRELVVTNDTELMLHVVVTSIDKEEIKNPSPEDEEPSK